jgi:replicative DNA helicase
MGHEMTQSKVVEIGPARDLDAEAALVAYPLCTEGGIARVVATGLEPRHFYADANRRIFDAEIDLHRSGRSVDVVSVAGWLKDRKRLEQIGGTPYLARLESATPAVANVEDYAQRVRDKWRERTITHKLESIVARARAGEVDVETLIGEAKSALEETASDVEQPAPRKLADLFEPAIALAELRRTGKERPVPVPFRDYSEALCGGYFPGVHVTVAGTGAGKSAFQLQIALHSAKLGVPVLYVGLELSETQVALRTLGEEAGITWSRLYTGRHSVSELAQVEAAIPALAGLPFYVEFNTAQGWAPSNLVARAEQIRKLHPDGPLFVVLDFLQLVGAEPTAFGGTPDVRERISRASYAAVHVANTFGAAVNLISSAARDKYGTLAGDAGAAGLSTTPMLGYVDPVRTIRNPDALIGLGKESGEIEFAAETQTVLIKWPVLLESGERAVLAALPKVRYAPPRWVPFSFWTRFAELPFRSLDELPQLDRPTRGRPPVDEADLSDAVLATLRRLGPSSKRQVVLATKGKDARLYQAIKDLVASGKVIAANDGTLSAADNAQEPEDGQQ